MTPIEAERQIAELINEAEVCAATISLNLAKIDQIATDELAANYATKSAAKAERKYSVAAKTAATLKKRLSSFHDALQAAAATATFPRPRTGK